MENSTVTEVTEDWRAQYSHAEAELSTAREQHADLSSQLSEATAQEALLLNRVKVGLSDVSSVAPITAQVASLSRLVGDLDAEIERGVVEVERLWQELDEAVLLDELRALALDLDHKADAFNAALLDAAKSFLASLQTLKSLEKDFEATKCQIGTKGRAWIAKWPKREGMSAYASDLEFAKVLFAGVAGDGTDTRNAKWALPCNDLGGRLPFTVGMGDHTQPFLGVVTRAYLEKRAEI